MDIVSEVKVLRAQVSIEFSLLLLVSLVVLAISIAAIQQLAFSYGKVAEHKKHLYDLRRLEARIDEVCLSGVGSARSQILLTNISEDELNLSLPCHVTISDGYGKVLIEKVDKDVVKVEHIG